MTRRAAGRLSRHSAKPGPQQILQVPSHAINRQKPEIVQVQAAAQVRFPHFRRINLVKPINLADVAGDVVVQALQRIGHIAVFLDLPIGSIQVLVDQVQVRLLHHFADTGVLVTIEDVCLRRLFKRRSQQSLFNEVLNILNGRN